MGKEKVVCRALWALLGAEFEVGVGREEFGWWNDQAVWIIGVGG